MDFLALNENFKKIKDTEETKLLIIFLAIFSTIYLYQNVNFNDYFLLLIIIGMPLFTIIWIVNKVCDAWIKVNNK